MPYRAAILAQHSAEVSDSLSSGDRYYGAEGEPVGVQYRIYKCQSSRKEP